MDIKPVMTTEITMRLTRLRDCTKLTIIVDGEVHETWETVDDMVLDNAIEQLLTYVVTQRLIQVRS